MDLFAIGLIILGFFYLWFLAIKYLFIPILKPKLTLNESIKFLEVREYIYIAHKELNREELTKNYFNRITNISIKNIMSVSSEFKIIGYCQKEKSYKLYWIEITLWLYTFGRKYCETLIGEKINKKRELKYLEEKDVSVLENLKNTYKTKTIKVSNECPACGFDILQKDLVCKNCGLNFG